MIPREESMNRYLWSWNVLWYGNDSIVKFN
jgi:hypothetical protein